MKKSYFSVGILLSPILFFNCTSGTTGIGSLTSTSNSVRGTVSAGPIALATIKAYSLNADGTLNAQLATTTTDTSGKYKLNLPAQSAPVAIIASGGTYNEEASGNPVSLGSAQLRTLLPNTTATQQIAITPVTEIAAQQALTAIGSNTTTEMSAIIKSSNSSVAVAMGLSDITIPPADPTQPPSEASSAQAAKYAVVLAGISQMANLVTTNSTGTINSLDIMQALATSFSYNGNFNATLTGAVSIPVPNQNGVSLNLGAALTTIGGSTDFATAMQTAATAAATQIGYTPPPSSTFSTTPTLPTGQAALTLPAPPSTLPYLPPAVSGPPPVVGQPGTAAPQLSYASSSSDSGTIGYPMMITPSALILNGADITGCAIKTNTTALPAGLSVNSHTCIISGTPTVTTSATQYTLVATNSIGTSSDAVVTLTVSLVSPHIYIADINFGDLICGINISTGLLTTCAPHSQGNFLSHDMSAVTTNGVTSMYIASGGGITPCTVNVPTGVLSCTANSETPLTSAKRATMHKNSAGVLFGYAIDSNGINLCPTTNGVPGNCQTTNDNLALPVHVQGNYSAGDWQPEAIDFFTATGGSTYAYVLEDHSTGSIFICSVDNTSGVLSNCSASTASGIPQFGGLSKVIVKTIGSNTYLYGALGGYAAVLKCTINAATGALGNCGVTNGGIAQTPGVWSPVSISISNLGASTYYAYLADQVSSAIYVCSVSSTDGTLSACAISQANGLEQPDGLIVF